LAIEEAIHQCMVVETIIRDDDVREHRVPVEEMVETMDENCPRVARDHCEMQKAAIDTDNIVVHL